MTRAEIEQQLLITIKELKEERSFLCSEIERLGCYPERLKAIHHKPITYTYTRKHMVEYAKQYLDEMYGPVKESEDEDKWFVRLGMLVDFLSGPFPK